MTDDQTFDQFVTLGFRMMGPCTSEARDAALKVLVAHLDNLDVDVPSTQTFESLNNGFVEEVGIDHLYYTALMQYIALDYSLRKLNALDKIAKVQPALQNYYKVLMAHPRKCSGLRSQLENNLKRFDLTRRHQAGLDAAIAFHEYMLAMSA